METIQFESFRNGNNTLLSQLVSQYNPVLFDARVTSLWRKLYCSERFLYTHLQLNFYAAITQLPHRNAKKFYVSAVARNALICRRMVIIH